MKGILTKVKIGDWRQFQKAYMRDGNQWYLIPKAKGIDEEQLEKIQFFLKLLDFWFVQTNRLKTKERKFLEKFYATVQMQLHINENVEFSKWGRETQLFMTCLAFMHGLISREQENEIQKKHFAMIIEYFKTGKSYHQIIRKFGRELIHNTFCANSRNLINLCQRLGFAWIEQGRQITVTSVGKEFIQTKLDFRPIIERQLRKYQFHNRSITAGGSRYEKVKILPYQFTLEVMMLLKDGLITKEEFTLFVTKAVSMVEMKTCVRWINAYRKLKVPWQRKLISSIDRKLTGQARSRYVELGETSSKNILFLAFAGPWKRCRIGSSYGIVLTDREKAAQILAEDAEREFIEVGSKEAWFAQYGNKDRRLNRNEIIEYYTRIGNTQEAEKLLAYVKDPKVKKDLKTEIHNKLREKEIEIIFLNNLDRIEKGLKVYHDGTRSGQQYETIDGGVIDLIAVAKTGEFVVLEFKRAKIPPDKTIGQILRYMGWVRKNLSEKRVVRGYIIAYEFDKYLEYALIGMQHPLQPNKKGKDLIGLYGHGMNVQVEGPVKFEN